MAPAEISAQHNPLRSPKDYRLNRIAGPSSLIIFGVTGDLSRKKLMPAVYDLANRGLLPPGFALVGFARRDWDDQDFEKVVHDSVQAVRPHRVPRGRVEAARPRHPLRAGRLRRRRGVRPAAATVVEELDRERGTMGNHAFYLSIPPKSFPLVTEQLKRSGLTEQHDDQWRRVVIEKPFGSDLQSARELNDVVASVFPPDSRVPHRPLPGQGDGPEHPGPALREPALRADLERQLRRPRADHDGRGHRRRRPCRLLRRHRRGARRHPEPPAAAPRAHGDGGADLVRRRRPARREGEDPRGGAPARGPRHGHRPRPVRGRMAGRREGASASSTRTG